MIWELVYRAESNKLPSLGLGLPITKESITQLLKKALPVYTFSGGKNSTSPRKKRKCIYVPHTASEH